MSSPSEFNYSQIESAQESIQADFPSFKGQSSFGYVFARFPGVLFFLMFSGAVTLVSNKVVLALPLDALPAYGIWLGISATAIIICYWLFLSSTSHYVRAVELSDGITLTQELKVERRSWNDLAFVCFVDDRLREESVEPGELPGVLFGFCDGEHYFMPSLSDELQKQLCAWLERSRGSQFLQLGKDRLRKFQLIPPNLLRVRQHKSEHIAVGLIFSSLIFALCRYHFGMVTSMSAILASAPILYVCKLLYASGTLQWKSVSIADKFVLRSVFGSDLILKWDQVTNIWADPPIDAMKAHGRAVVLEFGHDTEILIPCLNREQQKAIVEIIEVRMNYARAQKNTQIHSIKAPT